MAGHASNPVIDAVALCIISVHEQLPANGHIFRGAGLGSSCRVAFRVTLAAGKQ